jgi:hypothetical protein
MENSLSESSTSDLDTQESYLRGQEAKLLREIEDLNEPLQLLKESWKAGRGTIYARSFMLLLQELMNAYYIDRQNPSIFVTDFRQMSFIPFLKRSGILEQVGKEMHVKLKLG